MNEKFDLLEEIKFSRTEGDRILYLTNKITLKNATQFESSFVKEKEELFYSSFNFLSIEKGDEYDYIMSGKNLSNYEHFPSRLKTIVFKDQLQESFPADVSGSITCLEMEFDGTELMNKLCELNEPFSRSDHDFVMCVNLMAFKKIKSQLNLS